MPPDPPPPSPLELPELEVEVEVDAEVDPDELDSWVPSPPQPAAAARDIEMVHKVNLESFMRGR
jgi:hypothetical protein